MRSRWLRGPFHPWAFRLETPERGREWPPQKIAGWMPEQSSGWAAGRMSALPLGWSGGDRRLRSGEDEGRLGAARTGQRQTSPFRSWDFKTAAFVLLGADDYRVVRASLLPVGVVKEHARWRQHINGHVVMMTPLLLDHPDAINVTMPLSEAAVSDSE